MTINKITTPSATNPYVGPRTFRPADATRFYGREREARDLVGQIISQRLTVFYAQSGAGKSSLINTRVVPSLQERGFAVLPVGRVSGTPPPSVEQVDNIFLFNLMLSMDQRTPGKPRDPNRFAHVTLSQFLTYLVSDDGINYYYDETLAAEMMGADEDADEVHEDDYATVAYGEGEGDEEVPIRFLLIIDQFEEIVTTHLGRWQERNEFFRQLNQAMRDDPNVWVMLSLREDYIAALEPYAGLMDDNMRARFYMERMEAKGALQAIAKPALVAGRPFATGVAEAIVDNLRRIHGHGDQDELGQYIEPVQLQVVCYQLWEHLKAKPLGPITADDVALDYVDQSLTAYYENSIRQVLTDESVQAADVTERMVRNWFSTELITGSGIRGTVLRNEDLGKTAGMPNIVVDLLATQFMIRMEPRGGGTWIELTHDRFVDPILKANTIWLASYDNPLTKPTEAWITQGRAPDQLLTSLALNVAQAYAQQHPLDVTEFERAFLRESVQQQQLAHAQEQRTRAIRRMAQIAIASVILILAFGSLAFWGFTNAQQAAANAQRAERNAQQAQVSARQAFENATQAQIAQQVAEAETTRALAAEREAKAKSQLALSNQLAAIAQDQRNEGDAELGLLLAVESFRVEQTAESVDSLRDALQRPPFTKHILRGHTRYETITSGAWSHSGAFIATGAANGHIAIWAADRAAEVRNLTGHEDAIQVLSWNADGARLFSASQDGTARIWPTDQITDTESMPSPLLLTGHTDAVLDGAWNATYDLVLTASADGTARIWDAQRGTELRVFTGHEARVTHARWHPDGTHVLTASHDGTARIWPLNGAREPRILADHTNALTSATWHPAGTQVATASHDDRALIWDVATGRVRFTLQGHDDTIRDVLWNKTGDRLLSISDDATARLWDTTTGTLLHVLVGHTRGIVKAQWNSAGNQVVTASQDDSAIIWDVDTGQQLYAFVEHQAALTDVAWNPAENYLLTTSADATSRIWNLALAQQPNGELPVLFGHNAILNTARWSVDGSRILTAGDDGTARIWNAQTGQTIQIFATAGDSTREARWSHNEKWVVTGHHSGRIRVWDAARGNLQHTIEAHDAQLNSDVTTVQWDAKDQRLLSSGYDGKVAVWDARSGTALLTLNAHDGAALGAHWYGAEQAILTYGEDGLAKLWDAQSGALRHTLIAHNDAILDARLDTAQTRVATASADGNVIIWDVETGAQLVSLQQHQGAVTRVVWNRAGDRLLTASTDWTARVWDVASGDELLELEDHRKGVTDVAWSQDETHILTASRDGQAILWDAEEGEEIYEFSGHLSHIFAARWTRSGDRIVTASADGTARQYYIDPAPLVDVACQHVARNIAAEVWAEILPNQPYRATCPNLPLELDDDDDDDDDVASVDEEPMSNSEDTN